MPSRQPTYKQRKNAKHKRNKVRKTELMAQGFSAEAAQRIIDNFGAEKHANYMARVQREKRKRRLAKRALTESDVRR